MARVLIDSEKLQDIDFLSSRDKIKLGMVIARLKQERTREPAPDAPKGGITIRAAERIYNIPNRTISRWVQRGLIPIVLQTKNCIYISELAIASIAKRYHEAPGRGKRAHLRETLT